MSTPTKQELQDQIRAAILQKDRNRTLVLWQAYQNKEYRIELPLEETALGDYTLLERVVKGSLAAGADWEAWNKVTFSPVIDTYLVGFLLQIEGASEYNKCYDEGIIIEMYEVDKENPSGVLFFSRAYRAQPVNVGGGLPWRLDLTVFLPHLKIIESNNQFYCQVKNESGVDLDALYFSLFKKETET